MVFVVDTTSRFHPGCEVVSVVDALTGRAIAYSDWRQSPGRLAATSDGSTVFSLSNEGGTFIEVMRLSAGQPPRWVTSYVNTKVDIGGPIDVSPDDQVLLVAMWGGRVEKYMLRDVAPPSLGPEVGRFEGAQAAEMLFAPDSRTVYILDVLGRLHVVDVATMTEQGAPVPFQPPATSAVRRIRNTFAALSPDGRYIVVNTLTPRLTVIDLAERRSAVVDAPGVPTTMGVAFNYAGPNHGLLAANGHSVVSVYRFAAMSTPELLASAVVPAQDPDHLLQAMSCDRVGAIAWTGRGDAVVAAIGGTQEFRILDIEPGPPWRLSRRTDFDSCDAHQEPEWHGMQLDVLTLNRPVVVPTPTPTATTAPSPTLSDQTSTPVPSPTATTSPAPTPTFPPSATTCPTPSPTGTTVPSPAYLPLTLRESPCMPERQRVDVALVIDSSTSMDQKTATGQTKLEAATVAALAFVDALRLPAGDQAAVVWFNETAEVAQPLTSDRAALVDALAAIPTRQFTRLDLGVRVGRLELASARHKAGNAPAMIVLTDGKANPVGPDAAVAEAALAKDEGVTVFTIGLGTDLDDAALAAMARRPEYFYRTTNPEDLAGIYARIAVLLPCPPDRWWGRR